MLVLKSERMARRTIMRKGILTILSALSLSAGLSAQTVDTTYIYKDRKDSLNAAVLSDIRRTAFPGVRP